jgi:hypothetical protein
MVTSINRIESIVNLFLNKILNCKFRSEISELCHILKVTISYHFVNFSCILLTAHQHIFIFVCVYMEIKHLTCDD